MLLRLALIQALCATVATATHATSQEPVPEALLPEAIDDPMLWTEATANAGWSARFGHTSVVLDNKLWVMGGGHWPHHNDVWWSADGTNWTQATANAGWAPRTAHSSVAFDNKLWVLGGSSGADVWSSADGVNWTQATANAGWSPRSGHSSVVFDDNLWVMGGLHMHDIHRDVWWSADGVNWTQATANAGWSARAYHTALVFDGKLWVMGGGDGHNLLSDVWWSADGISWTRATANAGWPSRAYPASLAFDNKLWVMGGGDGVWLNRNDVWWSTDGVHWTQATANAGWSERVLHTSVVFDNNLWVLGGIGASQWNDVWRWAPLANAGAVQVHLEPEAARAEGARWRLHFSDWLESGETLDALWAGQEFELAFESLPGWLTPELTFTPMNDETIVLTAHYVMSGGEGEPEPSEEVWVDFSHVGPELGTEAAPFSTLAEGIHYVLPGGDVKIVSGESSETGVITKAMTLKAVGGPVRLGVVASAPDLTKAQKDEAAMPDVQPVDLDDIAALLAAHFDEVDADGDGMLSADEIREFLQSRGIAYTEESIAKLVAQLNRHAQALNADFSTMAEGEAGEGEVGEEEAEEEERAPPFGCNGFFDGDSRSLLDLLKALWPLLLMGLVLSAMRRPERSSAVDGGLGS